MSMLEIQYNAMLLMIDYWLLIVILLAVLIMDSLHCLVVVLFCVQFFDSPFIPANILHNTCHHVCSTLLRVTLRGVESTDRSTKVVQDKLNRWTTRARGVSILCHVSYPVFLLGCDVHHVSYHIHDIDTVQCCHHHLHQQQQQHEGYMTLPIMMDSSSI